MKLEYTIKNYCYECSSFEQLHYSSKAEFVTGEMAYARALLNVKILIQELASQTKDSDEIISKLYKQIDDSYQQMHKTIRDRVR